MISLDVLGRLFPPGSLQLAFVMVLVYSASAKVVHVLFIRGLQLYLSRILPDASSIDLHDLYSPWLFIFILTLLLPKPLHGLLLPTDREVALAALKVGTLCSGVVMITQTLKLVKIIFKKYFDYTGTDNLRQRAITTQYQFVEKVIIITLWSAAFGAILCSFPEGRDFAKSLIASAGVLGIVITFAAQKSLQNLIAGFQIAFTQPIRLEDVVIVENQWGKVEKITLTYVVVCLWDLRRLIVPINYFIEKPFENWTKTSSDLLPYILFYFDFSLPVDAFRKEFESIVRQSPLWDRKVAVIQVIDTTEKTMVVRALMSARSAPEGFDLRCFVRERLISFVRANYPESFPKMRLEAEANASASSVIAPSAGAPVSLMAPNPQV